MSNGKAKQHALARGCPHRFEDAEESAGSDEVGADESAARKERIRQMSGNKQGARRPSGTGGVRGSLTPSSTPKNPPAPTNLVPMTPKPPPPPAKK